MIDLLASLQKENERLKKQAQSTQTLRLNYLAVSQALASAKEENEQLRRLVQIAYHEGGD